MYEHHLQVHDLPEDVEARTLAGGTVIVIDLLRASTTICQALAAGARDVVPFRDVEETLTAANRVGRTNVVLGGERGGRRIDGFDLGNSPAEYTPEAVGGRTVFITTTNGTQALYHARFARRVVVGALVNRSAVVASVKHERRIDMLCAGTNGRGTKEDRLAAGAMIGDLCAEPGADWYLNDAACSARDSWAVQIGKAHTTSHSLRDRLAIDLRNTPGGRNLIGIGLDQDLVDCAEIDRLNIVPELDVRAWRIHLAQ